MTTAALLALLNTIISATPGLIALIQKSSSGGIVTAQDVQAVFDKYDVDAAVFATNIAAAKAAGR